MPRHNCNCRFFDLFEPSPLLDVVPVWYAKGAQWFQTSPFRGVDLSKTLVLTENSLAEMSYTINPSCLADQKFVLFRNCYSDFILTDLSSDEYGAKVSDYLNRLTPNKSVSGKLFPLSSQTIGVHVRRTDNNLAIEKSPLPEFIAMMQGYVLEEPDTSFFLATDDPVAEASLKETFPGRIITFRKSAYSRAETAAIQEALVDLLMLSRCRKLLGSFYSSFSEYASMFHRIELLKTGFGRWHGPAEEIRHRPELKL